MLTVLIFLGIFLASEASVVQTQYGPILGAQRVSYLNRPYFSFQKIPYMKPPIGNLRFKDPEEPNSWIAPLDCTQEGPRFPQIDFTFDPRGPFEGDLDSMHINVYTNNLNPPHKYPVLVWIHGGGFRSGSGLTEIYGPDYFMEANVILVTFNYRLHAFGFLSLDDPTLNVPGNAGFKDQVMVLKWVHQNIHNFGGDPANITIFGQSSGGGCAHYHTVSEASKDLFQRSIIMSGSAFNPMYSAIPRRDWGYRLANALNYTGPNVDEQVLAFLEIADPQDMFNAVGGLLTPKEREDERLLNAFGPTIEPYDNGNAFLLAHPELLAINSWGNDIDILIGATSLENGALIPLVQSFPLALLSFANFESFVPANLNFSHEERAEHGETLKATYYGMMEPTITNIDGVVFMSNEFAFWHSVHRTVKQRWNSNAQGQTFVYRFDVDSDNNCFKVLNRVGSLYREPIHMDDLCHLFKTSFANVPSVDSVGYKTIEKMISIFTKFAATGNPQVHGWNPSDHDVPLTGYNIHDIQSTFGELPEVHRMEVWDTFYDANGSSEVSLFSGMLFTALLIWKLA